jgi:hypothetical protein
MISTRPVGWKAVSLALAFTALWSVSCADDDTILALNVTLKDSARAATSLEVTISQLGRASVAATITVPTMPVDGGAISKTSFYERIALSKDYADGDAKVRVVAKQGATTLATSDADIVVEAEGASAGYVTLGEARPVQPADAGTEDAGS